MAVFLKEYCYSGSIMAPPKYPKGGTSWGGVSDWYNEYLEQTEDSYQKKVILPNLLRVLGLTKATRVIDVACGQGYFTRAWSEAGAVVVGADIAPELIRKAKELSPTLLYHSAPAHKLTFAEDASFDVATMVLAAQNIENFSDACAEINRVLTPRGRFVLVLMHPAFRIPHKTAWGWDEEKQTQYRRVDAYLSQSVTELLVHPGKNTTEKTISYHRSLQDFSKIFAKNGFAVTKLEEWISHRKSGKGPRQVAEDKARKEFPLFLMLEVTKL